MNRRRFLQVLASVGVSAVIPLSVLESVHAKYNFNHLITNDYETAIKRIKILAFDGVQKKHLVFRITDEAYEGLTADQRSELMLRLEGIVAQAFT